MYDIALTEDLPPLERFAGIEVPVRIAAGERSPAGLSEVARRPAEAVPGAECRKLAGQNHMVSAAALQPTLREFLLEWCELTVRRASHDDAATTGGHADPRSTPAQLNSTCRHAPDQS